jgi:hypothetical protein
VQAHSFELELDTTGFSEYVRGGIVTQHKEPKVTQQQHVRQCSLSNAQQQQQAHMR